MESLHPLLWEVTGKSDWLVGGERGEGREEEWRSLDGRDEEEGERAALGDVAGECHEGDGGEREGGTMDSRLGARRDSLSEPADVAGRDWLGTADLADSEWGMEGSWGAAERE